MVRECHEGLGPRGVHRVACRARRRLQSLARIANDAHALDGERHAALCAEALAERGPEIGVGAEAVVNVQRAERMAAAPGEEIEQHGRVEPAGEADAHRRAGRQVRERGYSASSLNFP